MKVALVSLIEDQYWQSCYLITNGLRAAYLGLPSSSSIREWRISRTKSAKAVQATAAEITAAHVDLVVFIDTSPLYGMILKQLSEEKSHRPKLRFHVYGDFTMRAYVWKSWETYLRSFKTEWVCASNRQLKLVNALTNDTDSQNWVCPFPVSKAGFQFNAEARAKIRRKLGISPRDFVVYYAGRLALQKNVLACLSVAARLDSHPPGRVHFVFAGDFDDRGAPFIGTRLLEGEMFCLWKKELARLSPDLQKRIHVLGGVSHDALQETYSAADCFLSLSLQHDEDFGMAPAEAAISGLPLVLTSWGGYADFEKMGARAEMIQVTLNDQGASFDLSHVVDSLEKIASEGTSSVERTKRGRRVTKQLSVQATTALIAKHAATQSKILPFENFNPLLKDVSLLFDEARQHLVYPDCKEGSTYEKIYQHYI